MMYRIFFFLLLFAGPGFQPGISQALSGAIRLNQTGYYPNAPKIAIIAAETQGGFYLTTPGLKKKVFRGRLKGPQVSSLSGRETWVADFSAFRKTGKYLLVVPGLGHSYPFEIKPEVHAEVARAALKSFYFQRMSTSLPEKYAGKWHRPFSHPDTNVLVHASAASPERPAGTRIQTPGGWYDAGDYNKYIVNSGITVGALLALYEDFPDYFKKLEINIPESGNGVPDLLDELHWNLRWMLTMQDPYDGGAYHKCTTASFEGFVKPEEARAQRYVVQKSTQASLDFAAVMAQSARVYREFDAELPGFADTCLAAARRAWAWAQANPRAIYDQAKLNEQFDPDINTGAYGGQGLADEFIWAAAELYITSGEEAYWQAIGLFPEAPLSLQNWGDVRNMAYMSLLRHENRLGPVAKERMPALKSRFTGFADGLIRNTENQAYLAPMENDPENYEWGSTAVCANQGIVLIYAYGLTADKKYLDYALANLDYLLGRNATGYSFITGYGGKTPMHPHHRPSESDGVEEPVPGLIAGGPNPAQQDKCPTYPSKWPDESYTDDVCSYASNEIAINWNAAFVYLVFAMDILRGE